MSAKSIVARYHVAMAKVAMEFPTEEARATYLKEHPGADKSKHTVKKDEGGDKGGEGGKSTKSETFKPTRYQRDLGNRMQEWQGPDTPAINEVGSYLSGEHPVPRKKLMEAAKELEKMLPAAKAGLHGWTKKDVKSLTDMSKHLRNLHDNVD